MKFLDKVALNRLIQILTNFFLSLAKILSPKQDKEETPKRRRPVRDLLDKWF